MKKVVTSLSLSIFSFSFSFSQLDPAPTMFWNNPTAYNPAAAGLQYDQQAVLSCRSQLGKVSGGENAVFAAYNARADKLGGGIGFNYAFQGLGYGQQNRAHVNYSYHWKISDKYTLAAGVAAGAVKVYQRGMGNTLPSVDETAFTANAGVMLKADKMTVGVSTTQLNGPRFSDHAFAAPARNFHASADYLFTITRKVSLRPQVIYTTDTQFQRIDFNLQAYAGKFWAGASVRSGGYAFMAGYDLMNKLRIGYSYDLTVSKLNNGIWSPTHEALLSYYLKKQSRPLGHFTGTPSF